MAATSISDEAPLAALPGEPTASLANPPTASIRTKHQRRPAADCETLQTAIEIRKRLA